MTGRQEYDRTKDRQRILNEYMIDVKKVIDFPVPSWDVTYQTLPGRE
jgi:hypothetical protein